MDPWRPGSTVWLMTPMLAVKVALCVTVLILGLAPPGQAAAIQATDQGNGCPIGFLPASTGEHPTTIGEDQCYQAAVRLSGPHSRSYCEEGSITPDSTKCFVPAVLSPDTGHYLCDVGERVVVKLANSASGDTAPVVCILGDSIGGAAASASRVCLQGTLTEDELYCVVPRVRPRAETDPAPSFAG